LDAAGAGDVLITITHAPGAETHPLMRETITCCRRALIRCREDPSLLPEVLIVDRESAPPPHPTAAGAAGEPEDGYVTSALRGPIQRLLITAGSPRTPGGPGVDTVAVRAWQARTLGIMALMAARTVDLAVYLPTGARRLCELVEPTAQDDRYARLRPGARQLDAALAQLRGQPAELVDHAVVALALPYHREGETWRVGQRVEAVAGCWLADSRRWESTAGFNAARTEASTAALRGLGGRPGALALVVIERSGSWTAFEVPARIAALSA